MTPVALPGETTGERDAAVMSTVISAFIVTPFRRAGVINGAPTFTLYGLRRGSTCVVVGFPVVRVAVFAVRLNVGTPFMTPVALPGVTTGERGAAVMSTVISAFIVTPFRRAGVINGAPTFTLYGLRRGSTCVVAGFPVVRVAVFAVRRSVGAPFMTPVARQGEALRAWGGTMVFPVAVIENSVATTGFSVRAIGFSVGAGNVRIAPSAIFPTPSAVSSGLRARLVVRGERFRASMCRPRRADEPVAMP